MPPRREVENGSTTGHSDPQGTGGPDRGEDLGDLAGTLLGAEMLGGKDVGPHGDSWWSCPQRPSRGDRCAAWRGTEASDAYLLTTRSGFEMTDGANENRIGAPLSATP